MNTQSLKYYRTRYGAFGIVPADSPIVGDAVEVGAARKEEYAKLFAAAPELLEACQAALEDFTLLKSGVLTFEYVAGIIQELNSAIAKATE